MISRKEKAATWSAVMVALITSISGIVIALITSGNLDASKKTQAKIQKATVEKLAPDMVLALERLAKIEEQLIEERVWRKALQSQVSSLENRVFRRGGDRVAASRSLDIEAVEKERRVMAKERPKRPQFSDPRVQQYLPEILEIPKAGIAGD